MSDLSFFGWDIRVSEFWLMVTIFGGASVWAAYQLRKALKHGQIGFKGCDYSLVEHPFEYKLYVTLWIVILICAVAGFTGWYVDYSSSP